jgi:hypothetical protein
MFGESRNREVLWVLRAQRRFGRPSSFRKKGPERARLAPGWHQGTALIQVPIKVFNGMLQVWEWDMVIVQEVAAGSGSGTRWWVFCLPRA